jgi:outer membrane protein TolC
MRFTIGCFTLGLLTAAKILGQQNQFQGSVPTGGPSSTPIPLTLHEAIERGLKTNLGLLIRDSENETARGERLRALSALLPQLNSRVGETVQQLNLETVGFNFHFPGVSIPTIVGPFHYTDVRAYASWTAFDYGARKNYRASQENKSAAQLSVLDARDLVVQAARAERYPTAEVTADYGAVGTTLASSHGTFSFVASAKITVFDGGRIAGDIIQARSELKQRLSFRHGTGSRRA